MVTYYVVWIVAETWWTTAMAWIIAETRWATALVFYTIAIFYIHLNKIIHVLIAVWQLILRLLTLNFIIRLLLLCWLILWVTHTIVFFYFKIILLSIMYKLFIALHLIKIINDNSSSKLVVNTFGRFNTIVTREYWSRDSCQILNNAIIPEFTTKSKL